ncbi:MAG TPA: hypothetical protein VGV64_03840 [Thermoplasmata archaeon]|nr:hypothetical protein [Thermoplasmata archaeon]
MLSGPDLGAGFLYQLSYDTAPQGTSFTYHAQDGGADANGPPKGSPEPLGWSRSDGMCMFGGRACWHREFALPRARAGAVRQTYNRTRFVMQARLDQAYEGIEPPFEPSLLECLDRVGPVLARLGESWGVFGPSARRLRGVGGPPASIEIRTSAPGLEAAAEVLGDYLIEPAARTRWPDGPVLGARAFLGTLKVGMLVEIRASEGRDGPPPLGSVRWNGRDIPVALGEERAPPAGRSAGS